MNKQSGFSFVELLLYLGLTVIVLGLFSSILITTLRIQGQQGASRQVITELNFVMSVIKTEIRGAQNIEVSSTSIDLINASGTTVIIAQSGDKISYKLGTGSADPLTSDRVIVDALSFKKKTGSENLEAILVSMTFSNNSENPQQQASQTLQSTVAPLKQ